MIHVVLSSILSSHELEASHLDDVCDDDLFQVVVDNMVEYEILAPSFGVTDVEVREIKEDNRFNFKLAKRRFLKLWKDKNGSRATIHALVHAFLKDNNRDIADTIIGYVKEIVISCQSSDPDSVHPEKAVHRYPNWNDMSKEEKKITKEKLVVENRQVKKKFTTCFRRISQSFERQKTCVSSLKTSVRLLKNSKLPELTSTTSVKEVFFIISQHSSFFNYQLLQDIIEEMKNEEGQWLLSEYKNEVLKPYLQRSIFEVPADSTATSASKSSAYMHACLKFPDKIDLPVSELLIIKNDLAELLKLPSRALELADFDEGSILLFFAISKAIYDSSPSTSPLRKYVMWDSHSLSYIITDNIILIL